MLGKIIAAIPVEVPSSVSSASFTSKGSIVAAIINTLLYLIGALSIIMVIVGGLMYVFSAGSQKRSEQAKNTIIYAVVGLAIAILGYAIINFVIGRLS